MALPNDPIKFTETPAATLTKFSDVVPIVDTQDTSMDPTGTNKYSLQEQVFKAFLRAEGYDVQPTSYASTTTNLVGTYNNGTAGVGATITITATGVFTTDGTTPPINSLINVGFQSDSTQNGPYILTNPGAVGVQAILTRAPTWDEPSEITQFQVFPITYGSTYGNKAFQYVGASTPTIGTTSLPFSLMSVVTPSDIQNMTFSSGITSGTSSAYTLSISPAPSTLENLQFFEVQFHTGNSSSPTIAINDFSPIDLVDNDGNNLGAGVISSSGYVGLIAITNSGTTATLLNSSGASSSVTPADIQNMAFSYGTTTGDDEEYDLELTPTIPSLEDGQMFLVNFHTPNASGAVLSIQPLGLGPLTLVDAKGIPLNAGVIASANYPAIVVVSGGATTATVLNTSTVIGGFNASISTQFVTPADTTNAILWGSVSTTAGIGTYNSGTGEFTFNMAGRVSSKSAFAPTSSGTDFAAYELVLNGTIIRNGVIAFETASNCLDSDFDVNANDVLKINVQNPNVADSVTLNPGQSSTYWDLTFYPA